MESHPNKLFPLNGPTLGQIFIHGISQNKPTLGQNFYSSFEDFVQESNNAFFKSNTLFLFMKFKCMSYFCKPPVQVFIVEIDEGAPGDVKGQRRRKKREKGKGTLH